MLCTPSKKEEAVFGKEGSIPEAAVVQIEEKKKKDEPKII